MWYSASMIFECVQNGRAEVEDLWEHQVILVQAASADEVPAVAERLGKDSEVSYISATGAHVRWEFRKVLDVYELLGEKLATGSEVYSRLLRASGVKRLSTPFEEGARSDHRV